jgi:hypothetical protein
MSVKLSNNMVASSSLYIFQFILLNIDVIIQFWVIPQNSLFFQNENQKNKIKVGNVEKTGRGI